MNDDSAAALSPPEDDIMTFPEWTKPAVYGALVGAVVVAILGFTAGGWVTGASANKMARVMAGDKVTEAMVPVCLDMAATDPERVEKMASIQEANGYSRRKAIMDTGWATPPGATSPDSDLARACIDELDLDAS